MYKDHPERAPDEIYLGHFHVDVDANDGSNKTIYETIGWQTKRQGNNVEIDGRPACPEFRPVFVKQAEILESDGGGKEGKELLARLLPGSYTAHDIKCVIDRMTDLMTAKYDRRAVYEFTEDHPWTLKYLSEGFSEGNQLRDMASKPDFKIVLHVPTDREAALRKRYGKPQISYITKGAGREFQFRFEEATETTYKAISG